MIYYTLAKQVHNFIKSQNSHVIEFMQPKLPMSEVYTPFYFFDKISELKILTL